MIEKIAAGIVTYNPDVSKLLENLKSIDSQVSKIYIFDNASKNYKDIETICFDKVNLIHYKKNKGIAFALNRLFEYAETDGFEWLLTLDQDSVCKPNLIQTFVKHLDKADSLTTMREDVNYQTGDKEDNTFKYIERCITSGNLVKIKAWRKVRGFNERLFIDMVDVDFCFRLTQAGCRIAKIGKYGLQHEMGDGTTWNLFGKKMYIGDYSAHSFWGGAA